jgi:hypothetical protein
MNNKENVYHKGPYQAHVCGFFLGVPSSCCLLLVALVCLTELKRYCKFNLSLVRVIYRLLIDIFCSENNLVLVHASGKREQGSGPLVDRQSNGRVHQEQRIGAQGGS